MKQLLHIMNFKKFICLKTLSAHCDSNTFTVRIDQYFDFVTTNTQKPVVMYIIYR